MLLFEIIKVALESLRANKLRSFLTMLGIVIGVAAVITMVALGSGARQAVEEQIASLGANVLTVRPGQGFFRGARQEGVTLEVEDSEAVLRTAPLVADIAPEMRSSFQIEFGGTNANVRTVGTSASYEIVNNQALSAGRFFTAEEDQGRRRVAVLGGAVPALVGAEPIDLVGQRMRIGSIPFEIVGVLEEKGDTGWFNQDEVILVPLQTAQFRLIGTEALDSFSASIRDPEAMPAAMAQIETALRRQHRLRVGQENDFWIQDRTALLGTQQETMATFTFLLAGIAAVSLVGGGIGIMNIMLVSVTERTREIGVRKALGATRRAILTQFLLEALVLCLVGGLIGIGLGIGASMTLSRLADWNTDVSAAAILIAAMFSGLVGLFFGMWPANRAVRLDPIVALRYE
ncbi:ABC transporter permease [soil metagenome]